MLPKKEGPIFLDYVCACVYEVTIFLKIVILYDYYRREKYLCKRYS